MDSPALPTRRRGSRRRWPCRRGHRVRGRRCPNPRGHLGRTGTEARLRARRGAHAHWWTHVAARFSDDFVCRGRLVRHGDSAHRSDTRSSAGRGGRAAAEAGGISGHLSSSGTAWRFVTIATAPHAELVTGPSSATRRHEPTRDRAFHLREAFAPAHLPTVDDAVTTSGPCRAGPLPRLRGRLRCTHSLRAVDGGWQWKFDRQISPVRWRIRASPSLLSQCAADSRCCAPSMAS